jgi:signal transduction histidine kinase
METTSFYDLRYYCNINVRQALGTYELSELQTHAHDIQEQVSYLTHTISDFSDFFKPDRGEDESRLKGPIDKTLLIIDKLLENNDISLEVNCVNDENIFTYTKELQQVCINIIKNAYDALVELEPEDAYIHIDISCDDSFAYYKFSDNGGGVPSDVIDNIFDPYFSTKSAKNGTGLGLYMSKIIIEEHFKGQLECSNSDKGAVFTIKIPRNLSKS